MCLMCATNASRQLTAYKPVRQYSCTYVLNNTTSTLLSKFYFYLLFFYINKKLQCGGGVAYFIETLKNLLYDRF